MRFMLFIILTLLVASKVTFSQENEAPVEKELHQIFLKEPVKKVKDVRYIDPEKGAIEYKLSDDGTAIYLMNYDGEGGVKATVTNMDGKTEEITRSKCYIHSLLEL